MKIKETMKLIDRNGKIGYMIGLMTKAVFCPAVFWVMKYNYVISEDCLDDNPDMNSRQ